ncbi:MAG TPA: TRAFs-binding domain-containing protein, partial [Sphingobacteriaceae bacterium]|nr:TRAFs-binding domain-containing protein [Sphingobacteriaceae bacterium]
TKKYTEDPLVTAERALSNLTDRQYRFENEPEIKHASQYLANGHLIVANRALIKGEDELAYESFLQVQSIAPETYQVEHNLALLSHRLHKHEEAIRRYEALLEEGKTAKPSYIHALADIYGEEKKDMQVVNVLVRGHELYPNNKEILFRLINTYNEKQAYDAIVPLVEQAVKLDPENATLHYIAAYAFDVTGDQKSALESYERLIELDHNNYEGNLGIGLIYLEDYLKNPESRTAQNRAQEYLLRANQINPSGINTLRSLAVLINKRGTLYN